MSDGPLGTLKNSPVPAAQGPARARPPQPPAPNKAKTEESSPVPEAKPDAPAPDASETDPTRYGDWEKRGRCIDF
ncbi:MAG: hypothetical protein ACI82H_002356 [Alphaproteobacteria bacterium]|jgi:hypothetical protein